MSALLGDISTLRILYFRRPPSAYPLGPSSHHANAKPLIRDATQIIEGHGSCLIAHAGRVARSGPVSWCATFRAAQIIMADARVSMLVPHHRVSSASPMMPADVMLLMLFTRLPYPYSESRYQRCPSPPPYPVRRVSYDRDGPASL